MIQVRHTKRMVTEGLSFDHPSLLFCLDQMMAVTELSQHLVSSSKTIRPLIPRGARSMGHAKTVWSAVCSPAPHSHFAVEARTHLCTDEPKRPTPARLRLSLTQAILVKLIPIGFVPTLECRHRALTYSWSTLCPMSSSSIGQCGCPTQISCAIVSAGQEQSGV